MKTTVAHKSANTTVDDEGRHSSYSPFEVHICWKLRENKKNPPIHTGYFHTGEANTLIFSVDGGKPTVTLSCAQKCLQTWSCPLHVMASEINVALHQAVEKSVVESAAFLSERAWHWRTNSCRCQRHTS